MNASAIYKQRGSGWPVSKLIRGWELTGQPGHYIEAAKRHSELKLR